MIFFNPSALALFSIVIILANMRAEIISVGTEILLGHIINTNSAYLSKKLAHLGIDVYYHTTVGDNPIRLVSSLDEALMRADIVITTGGLGPTVDDITMRTIGSASSRALVFNEGIKKYIDKYFRKRGIKKTPEDALRQAYIPRASRWFENKVGTAPAVVVEYERKLIIALPGPPRELQPIFDKNIIPYFKKKGFAGGWIIKTKTIKTSGIAEVHVNKIIKDLLSMGPGTTLGIYAHLGEVHLKITSKAKNKRAADREIEKVEEKLRKRLGNFIYGTDGDTLESSVGKILTKKKKTLAIAESCTGGRIAERITNVSGSSKYFKMGVIAYANETKTKLLGITKEKLKKHGTVSKEVALEMASAVRAIAKTDASIGVTGIAGPGGGTKKKPVGLVYIAACGTKIQLVKKCLFHGTREEIKHQATTVALNLLRAIVY